MSTQSLAISKAQVPGGEDSSKVGDTDSEADPSAAPRPERPRPFGKIGPLEQTWERTPFPGAPFPAPRGGQVVAGNVLAAARLERWPERNRGSPSLLTHR